MLLCSKYNFLIIACTIVCWTTNAQPAKQQSQLFITSENDSYLSINNDGYYTNGIKIAYQWNRSRPGDTTLKIHKLEAGQAIYNGRDGYYATFSNIDRPVTGYLYAGYEQLRFNKKQNLLKWGIALGTIGKTALGEEMQILIHKWMNIYKPEQWQYQLPSDRGITGTVQWSPKVKALQGKYACLKPIAGAAIGNFFTHAMAGSALLLGKFNSNTSTAFWGVHAGSSPQHWEYFFYVYPALYMQAYNATVQGGLFTKEEKKISGRLNPLFFQSRIGCLVASNKFSAGFACVYENKQSLTQKTGQWYGSAQVSYMW